MGHKLIYCETPQAHTFHSVIPKTAIFWDVDICIFRVLLTWQEIFFLFLSICFLCHTFFKPTETLWTLQLKLLIFCL